MTQTIYLQRLPDGTLFDWGRHGKGVHRGIGGARVYTGEAARVMTLVVKHSGAVETVS